jgi:hypothetical protein
MGRGERPLTVPAMNLRAMAYDMARAAFRAAHRLAVGPMIFEIARSEIGYTLMRRPSTPRTSSPPPLGATKAPCHQGDHFQVNASKYKQDAASEIKLRD